MGIARKSADAVWTSVFSSGEYALVPSQVGNHQGQLRISIESVLKPGMLVVARDHRSTQQDAAHAVGPVGLKLHELNEYLEFLGNAGGDDRVRTLVPDDLGHLLAVVTRINGFLELGKKLKSSSFLTAAHTKAAPKTPKKKISRRFQSFTMSPTSGRMLARLYPHSWSVTSNIYSKTRLVTGGFVEVGNGTRIPGRFRGCAP